MAIALPLPTGTFLEKHFFGLFVLSRCLSCEIYSRVTFKAELVKRYMCILVYYYSEKYICIYYMEQCISVWECSFLNNTDPLPLVCFVLSCRWRKEGILSWHEVSQAAFSALFFLATFMSRNLTLYLPKTSPRTFNFPCLSPNFPYTFILRLLSYMEFFLVMLNQFCIPRNICHLIMMCYSFVLLDLASIFFKNNFVCMSMKGSGL